MKTKNVNIKFDKNFDVYCGRGRGFRWNPNNCEIGEYGWLGNPIAKDKICPICSGIHADGGSTLSCYEKYLKERLKDKDFLNEFMKLKGKTLGCFCKPRPCHTDIMIKYLEELLK